MNIRPYFQDLSESALRETAKIFKDPEHPKFVSRMARLLSQCDKSREIFSLVGRQGFINAWPKILKYWKRTPMAADYRDWWQTIYERLLERDQAGKSPVGMPLKKLQIMGTIIMQARTAKGWTQQDLAQKARLKQPDVSAIEKGRKNLTVETLARLEQILEIELFATEKLEEKHEQPADIEKQPFVFTGSRQHRIYKDLLELIGPGAADFYKDAYRLLEPDSDFESKTLLIGHLFREIESSIRAVLVGCFGIKVEKNKKNDKQKLEIEGILEKLKIDLKKPWTKTWLQIADENSTYALFRLAHRNALSQPRDLSSEMKFFFNEFQDFLEGILFEIRRIFVQFLPGLDQLLSKSEPTERDVKYFLNKIPNTPGIRGYFFESCNDKWMGLLKMQDVFKYPPAPVSLEDRTTTFPYWPEAVYLARMASIKPEEVCEIILKMSATKNIAVNNNLAEAVLALPAALTVCLIDKIKLWAQVEYPGYALTKRLGNLITHLASAGKVDQALDLAGTMLEIQPDPKFQSQDKEDKQPWSEPQPRTRINLYDYKDMWEKRIPELVTLAGLSTLNLLCDLLEKSVTYSGYPGEDIRQCDSSYIWRPAIEPHKQNQLQSIKSILVDAVRNTAERLSRNLQISVLVNLLEARPYKIFKRLALHLLSQV
ncbi:helix-turn-helix domain-containing protein, partial [bacterium]|nr:helix-turn-helix domain-containing protein [bacterium]